MNTTSQAACPKCRTPVPRDAPHGLCPGCLGESIGGGLGERHGGSFTLEFGPYDLLLEVGRGGAGVVFRARDRRTQALVALKILTVGRFASPLERDRFAREAQLVAALDHPGIVPFVDMGEEDGQPYLAMRWIEGQSLADRARREPPPFEEAARIIRQAANALAHAHARGVIHRDIKPSNILIQPEGEVCVVDFGLARHLEQADALTRTGDALGTPGYMPPEQCGGKPPAAGPASDVYALGGALYFTLTGRPPFLAGTHHETVSQLLHDEPASPRRLNPATPRGLETICLKCLRKDPAGRYQTARELAEDLDRFLKGEPVRARPIGLAGRAWRWGRRNRTAASAAALIAALAAGFSWHNWRVLSELRSTAPTFAAESRSMVEKGQWEAALERIRFARRLVPRNGEYRYQEGNILQTSLRLAEARSAYAAALQLAPHHKLAALNQGLCEELLRASQTDHTLPAASLERLRAAILAQGRVAEAMAVAQRMRFMDEASLQQWREHLRRHGVAGALQRAPDGGLGFKAGGAALTNLAALTGMPLSHLDISHTAVSDLGPLRGMPLRSLNAEKTPISDLEPLRGLPLEDLILSLTKVSDFGPLKGMGIIHLTALDLSVSDLTPLKGMPLRYLNLYNCRNISDLSPLESMTLGSLDLYHTRVSDLTPLRGMPLHTLNLCATRVSDLSPLQGAPLIDLNLAVTAVSDLSPVRGASLGRLILTGARLRDLGPISYMPLQQLMLDGCSEVRDISPISTCRRLERLILPPKAAGLEFLRNLPNLKKLGLAISADHNWDAVPASEEFWKTWETNTTTVR